ncbi:MAG: hypothetical protein JNL38_30105 [Myxococcales bacterium]|nr:hypothetical protein [Myxococcales bacterium]
MKKTLLSAGFGLALLAGCSTGDDIPGGTPAADCTTSAECTAGSVCTAGKCRPASATNGVKDEGETDVDCGGPNATPCDGDKACAQDSDCKSLTCVGGKCTTPSDADGKKNGDETDVDCGGPAAKKCVDGKACKGDPDCASGNCASGTCQPASATDGKKDGDETGVDCGGASAPKCGTGGGCKGDADCVSASCDTAAGACRDPQANDGKKNGDETDVDCGGAAAPKCDTGKVCKIDGDCASDVCKTGKCAAPSPTDGKKNGDETDVDCGGATAPKCLTGKACKASADCKSDGCNYKGKCVEAPSCAKRFGGDTCGTGEVGQFAAVHESCCRSIPLSASRLDKYLVTAGRMREFVSRVGPDIRAWVAAHPAETAQIAPADYAYLPDALGGQYGIYSHLGNQLTDPAQGGQQGCWHGPGATDYAHNTYWWPDAIQAAQWGAAPRTFGQDVLDQKPLNCVTWLMMAAFCAWDGGRLATEAEINEAWGGSTYPWGSAPAYNDNAAAYLNWNKFGELPQNYRYSFPLVANLAQTDQSFAISAPGRFPNDTRIVTNPDTGLPEGWKDLAGVYLQFAVSTSGGPRYYGYSWEGHANGKNFNSWPKLYKYGKMGGRCARAL